MIYQQKMRPQPTSRLGRLWSGCAAVALGMTLALGTAAGIWAGAGAGLVMPARALATETATGSWAATAVDDDAPDRLIFKDGRIIKGKVLKETDTQVTFMVVVGGISAPATYNKSDILAIERGKETNEVKAGSPRTGNEPDRPANPDAGASDEPEAAENAPKIFVYELKGTLGRDISPTPIRQAIKDAASSKPDYLILVVNNTWQNRFGQDLKDEDSAFDQLFITEDIEPIFTKEIKDLWGYQPKIVVWVKNAMGGMAFLPLNFKTIYFTSDAKMGGIGNLTELFGTMGDERVREKQFSLRMGHARGMAVRGGYDTRIVKAMARTDYVLSYRIENGKPVLVERMPKTELGEHLLTDDGAGDNKDTDYALVRSEGNDTLTLTADVARNLGISKGTVNTLDDLLYELDLDREHKIVKTRADMIMSQWSRNVGNAERQIMRLWGEFNDQQVTGDRRERTMARAKKMRKLQEIIALLKKYAEVNKVRLLKIQVPPIPTLEVMLEQIKQEQMKDRP